MPQQPTSLTLLQRLKERKLVQWALAYLAGAFVVFQLLDALAEPLGLTTTIQRAVLAVVGVGFFIALVLAWYHGEKGRQRVSGPELLMVAALLVIAGGVLSVVRPRESGPEPAEIPTPAGAEDDRPSIAVLACENISPDPTDAFYAEGLHEEILLRLQKISSLSSTGRASVLWYEQSLAPPTQIAQELGVGFVGECSVRKDENRIRLTFQLLSGETGVQIWAENYDRDLTTGNLFDIESEVAQRVAQEIGARLTPEERDRVGRPPTEDLEAYEALMRGLYHLRRRDKPQEAYQEAVGYLQDAVEQDPNLAPAHAALAMAYAQIAMWGLRDPGELWRQAEAWAESALALDETEPLAHTALAVLKLADDWAWEDAEQELQRSIELSPNEPLGHMLYGQLLMAQGRFDEWTRERRIMTALDPLSPATFAVRAFWAFHSRDYEAADELIEVLVARDPTNSTAAYFLMLSSLLGEHPEQGSRLTAGLSVDLAALTPAFPGHGALLLSLASDADSARILLGRVVTGSGDRFMDPYWVWPTYAALGEPDQAFHWMERAIETQSWMTVFLGVTPLADPLRDDPRYQAILDRIRLGHLKERFDSLASADPRGGI